MTPDWSTALGTYLAIGALVLVAVLAHHRLTQPRKSAWVQAALSAAHPERRALRYRLLADIAAPALASLFILIMWPIALAVVGKWRVDSLIEERRLKKQREEKINRPAVAVSDLVDPLSIAEVEERETVTDPLGAVPPVPFGHLSATWISFRAQLTGGDVIWSFRARSEDEWGMEEQTAGYAAVRDGKIVAHMIKTRKRRSLD